MQKFLKLKSIPAHIPLMNIDTDMIIPKQFFKDDKKNWPWKKSILRNEV